MSIEIEGLDELLANLETLKTTYSKEIMTAMVKGGNAVRNTAIQSIQSKSSGRTVTRTREGGERYTHIAAAAGAPPNTDTGALVRSINVNIQPDAVFVGSSLEYAPWLEFGTARMLPRPWLNPALEENRRRIEKWAQDAVNRTTERGGNP
jgi:HK97 gp10 family phage protein